MKWIRAILCVSTALILIGPVLEVFALVMDFWSGLWGPEYHAARVLLVTRAMFQTTTILLFAIPILSLKFSRHEVTHSAVVLAVSTTLLIILALSAVWNCNDPYLQQAHPECWKMVVKTYLTIAGCLVAATAWGVAKLVFALRSSKDMASRTLAILVVLHVASGIGFVEAIRLVKFFGEQVVWLVPIVKSPGVLQLPHHDICRFCGKTNIIDATFDDKDYELLSVALDAQNSPVTFLNWMAPYCSVIDDANRWDGYVSLNDSLPHLHEDTFNSFVQRNQSTAVHCRRQFQTRKGKPVWIVNENSRNIELSYYARVGINEEGTQALLYRGTVYAVYELWEKLGENWMRIESTQTHSPFPSGLLIRDHDCGGPVNVIF